MSDRAAMHSSPPGHRRFRFQLTSLMDLLLIIVFAQFMEYRQASEQAQLESRNEIEALRAELTEDFAVAEAELQQQRQQWLGEKKGLRAQRDEAIMTAEQAERQRRLSTETIVRLLQLPPGSFDPQQSPPESSERVDAAQRRVQALDETSSTQVLRFLAGYEELLKRAELWTLHVSDRGEIIVQAEEQSASFRLEAANQQARTEEFIDQLRAAYNGFDQPKGLVVLLVSYSPRAIAGNYQPVLDGLPAAVSLLTEDTGKRTRFEFAVLGAVADPQVDVQRESRP